MLDGVSFRLYQASADLVKAIGFRLSLAILGYGFTCRHTYYMVSRAEALATHHGLDQVAGACLRGPIIKFGGLHGF